MISLEPAQPTTTPEAIAKAEAQAKRAVAAPITLTLGDRQAQLTPQTIAANLTFGSDGEGSLAPQFDAKTALTGVESSLVDAAQVPRDATYDVVNGKLVLVPARQGRGVNSKLLARDLAKLVRNGGPRVIPVRLAAAPPQVTTEQVTGLGIKENVASFTSTFECCLPRVTNIRQMAADIDGQLVLPGQTFSLNDVVGERTAEGGYVLAPQTVGGRVVTVVGGGASQLATTLYNAAFFGGFDDVAHTPMDYHSNRYPAGRDAALLYPGVDLKWRNDSEHGVLIKTASTATSVTVALWSTKRYDKIEAVDSAKRDFTPFRVETGAAAGCMAGHRPAGLHDGRHPGVLQGRRRAQARPEGDHEVSATDPGDLHRHGLSATTARRRGSCRRRRARRPGRPCCWCSPTGRRRGRWSPRGAGRTCS